MKKLFAGLTIATLATVAGCSQGTPGGPGTSSTTAKKPAFGQTDDTFNLSVPMMSSALQQGEQLETTIGIKRAKNFDEDVALSFADLPKGVTVEPAKPVIKHGDVDAKIHFNATNEVPVGEFKIKVTGHPQKGGDANVEFALNITARDSFTLIVPRFSTSLTQGKAETVVIGIKRGKKFEQDVALNFGEMPAGVTRDPANAVIKQGESETKVKFMVADDAALGNFDVKLTGHPAAGADASTELKLAVVQN